MCRSFELTWGWQKQTASDTVHAVTALLDMTTAKQLAANDDAKDRFWYTRHLPIDLELSLTVFAHVYIKLRGQN